MTAQVERQIDPIIAAKIDAIDLTNCRNRLMDPKLGKGWSAEKADTEILKYRRFLKLASTGMSVVPTKNVDEVWHTHILDTEVYAKDCQTCFGYFLHHHPYMEDSKLQENWKTTNQAYEGTFGARYSKDRGTARAGGDK
jgi:hypothetical protein